MEHVGIRFISRGTLTIINLDILHIRLICVTYCWCAKAERVGRAGDRRFKCDFDAKCICEKKPVVVSMLRRDKIKICVFGPAKEALPLAVAGHDIRKDVRLNSRHSEPPAETPTPAQLGGPEHWQGACPAGDSEPLARGKERHH